jgi:hypothetical protein
MNGGEAGCAMAEQVLAKHPVFGDVVDAPAPKKRGRKKTLLEE